MLFAKLAKVVAFETNFFRGTSAKVSLELPVAWNHRAGQLPNQLIRPVLLECFFRFVDFFVDIVFPRHFDSSCLINFAWALENITQKRYSTALCVMCFDYITFMRLCQRLIAIYVINL